MDTPRVTMTTAAKPGLSKEQINVARGAMEVALRRGFARRSADHDDWIQEALITLRPVADETERDLRKRAILAVRTQARDAVRANKRRKDAIAREMEPAAGTIEMDKSAQEEAAGHLERASPVSDVATLNLRVTSWRRVDPEELTLASIEERLVELATISGLVARREPSSRASSIAAVLLALSDKNPECDDRLQATARKQLGAYRGPESAAVQRASFISAVRTGLPFTILNRLRSSPAVAQSTRVPLHGTPWDVAEEATALDLVADVIGDYVAKRAASLGDAEDATRIERETAVQLGRKILRQLGADAAAVQRLDQRERRARARGRRTKPDPTV